MKKEILTKDDAIKLIGKKESVHTFVNKAGLLIGCNISWDSFIEKLDKAEVIELSGETAIKLNHPLCLKLNNQYIFIG